MMSEHVSESGENVSEIQVLTARTQDLGRSIDAWNSAYVVLVAITVVLAAGVFWAQFVVIRKSRLLAGVQDALIAEKDRQSLSDSKAKDLRIADATKAAADANERAGQAEEEAGRANERAAQANEAAERERLARIKIEERLGGWKLSKDAQDRVVNALKPFAGTHFSLSANPVEQSFVTTIDRVLTNSGWVRESPVDDNGNPATVLLDMKALVTFSSGLSVMVSHDQFAELSPAAAAYKQALIAEGLEVKLIEALPPASKIAPTVLKIRIGNRE